MNYLFSLVFKVCTHFIGVDPYTACLALICFSSLTLGSGLDTRSERGKKSRAGWQREERKTRRFLRLPLAAKFQINLVFLLLCPPFNPLMQVENLTPLYWWGLLQLSCVAQNSYLFHPHLLLEFISCAKLCLHHCILILCACPHFLLDGGKWSH